MSLFVNMHIARSVKERVLVPVLLPDTPISLACAAP